LQPCSRERNAAPGALSFRFALFALLAAATLAGCKLKQNTLPALRITLVPPSDAGGPQKLDRIGGTVAGAKAGQRIVIYAHSGPWWWIQPLADQPYTQIEPDGSWTNSIHLGTEYAALLVDPSYHPDSRVMPLPGLGKGVLAVMVTKGTARTQVAQKTLHFSGYDWIVRSAGSSRGGESNEYDSENARVDSQGFLHLSMQNRNGKWSCAEVNLARTLGYGTYRFVVQDTGHLAPSAVVGLFTWDDVGSEGFRNELDVELSRWGDPKGLNAQYVVQPFYVPENVSRFSVPSGVITHEFRWEPGKVSFESVRGSEIRAGTGSLSQHVFTTGIPIPASETVHIDLYDFHHSRNKSPQPSEVVIEKFEYLP
jgi:hypothetical protein